MTSPKLQTPPPLPPLDEYAPRPDPALWIDGGAWKRRDYTEQVEYRVRIRQRDALYGRDITREEFRIACQFVDDPAFRARIEALVQRADLEQIRREQAAIEEEEFAELHRLRQQCEQCRADGAAMHERTLRVLCSGCVNEFLSAPSNPPVRGILSALARARRARLPATLTDEQWKATVEHFEDRCAFCGGPWCAVEHATPIEQGGGTTAANCLPVCTSCNVRKGSMTIEALPRTGFSGWKRADQALEWLRQQGRGE